MPFEFDLDVRELDEYRQRLEAAGGTVGVAARGVVQNYSNKVSIEAKRLAPVDTGRLRDSIEPDRRSEGSKTVAAVSIVAAAPYSGFVEFGTVNMAPQPFMRPALAKYRRAFQNDIAEAGAELVGSKTAARAATRGRSQGPFNRTRALSNARGNV